MVIGGILLVVRLIIYSIFLLWKLRDILMGEEVLKLLYIKGLVVKKINIILNIFF